MERGIPERCVQVAQMDFGPLEICAGLLAREIHPLDRMREGVTCLLGRSDMKAGV